VSRAPGWSLILDGGLLSLDGRLISLSITDYAGFQADDLRLSISDHDGAVALPKKGAVIEAAIGWGNVLIPKGKFTVDEVTHSGAPDKIDVSAKSADFSQGFAEQTDKSWHQQTIGQIVITIANKRGWQPKIHQDLANIKIEHIDQTSESDAHFLTRLGKRYDALASVKDAKLLFMPHGKSESVSGSKLSALMIERQKGDQHNYRNADRGGKVTGVRAFYHNQKSGKRKKVEVGKSGYRRQIRATYATKAEAQAAAKAKWNEIQRGKKSLSLTLAFGQAELFPGLPVVVLGFKPEIDAQKWLVKQVTHNLSDSGYTAQVELESGE